ncbi:DUF3987 domain-containing protein [Pontibaca salina]|uniref:DUF3987 domain-containing protein n=1 Tax=Pontibaca salina TaxID=2795731 RepID=A0A934HME0_9RHOB|nr:DUF3987 domain-containing protein [Pontibaca salina]MBI6630889.1 DUF3987 domain-containing protein [Pontibaca salina]
MTQKPSKKTKPNTAPLFTGVTTLEKGKKRPLNELEQSTVIAMLSIKERPDVLSIDHLVPKGSFIERLLGFFKESDISYALPLWQLIMLSASILTQGGATLSIPGMKEKRPILWTIVLAPSGSSKTLATDTVTDILSDDGEESNIAMFPNGGTDAQWIIDLDENNGTYVLQDEVGQWIEKVLKDATYARIKPWMLDSYSHKPISNRLKSENQKLTIEDPHFTFMGLSVRETWKDNVNAASMLDGFCQRFNYVMAPPREDTDMFDHFLYFVGENVGKQKAELFEIWNALRHQPEAMGVYQIDKDVMPYLDNWWSSLRAQWGSGALPASFIRRTGFSVLSYLVILQFLLGRSRRPIDIETAELATKYAEFHMECALTMMREYGDKTSGQIQKVAALRTEMQAKGNPKVSARDIQRRLSANQRREISTDMTKQILAVLERLEIQPDLFEGVADTPKDKSSLLQARHQKIQVRDQQREAWRNRARIRKVRDLYKQQPPKSVPMEHDQQELSEREDHVIDITERIKNG